MKLKLSGGLVLAAICMCLMACTQQEQKQGSKGDRQQARKENVKKNTDAPPLTIYMYGNFPKERAGQLATDMKTVFPKVELVDQRLTMPAAAFSKERNRYRGSGLLDDLKKHLDGNVVLGLTDKVIYNPIKDHPYWGIMGLSYRDRKVALASLKIPKNGTFHDRITFFRLALHEVGHAYGLPHCPDQKCIMVDAEHRYKLKNTPGFCADCKAKLVKKGWNIK